MWTILDSLRRWLLRPAIDLLEVLVATVNELKDQLVQLKTDVETERQQAADRQAAVLAQLDAQTAEIARLNDIIANGGAVSQADLDALAASVAEVNAAVKNIIPDTA